MLSQKCGQNYQTNTKNTSLLLVKDHHLYSGSRMIIPGKLCSKELYSLLISAIDHQPTWQNILIVYFLILNYLGKKSNKKRQTLKN